ncbi:hypothetical protein DdX_18138 [Ditylenchus destructor]|uniref:Uncharacterized protein n=1 Tax=Ditylenchus destructor TaxID=166010 RepID=A0AAD4MLS2_9BILA|nr:hypothetical protein DdX_18138 [Ditylenchus destructor]
MFSTFGPHIKNILSSSRLNPGSRGPDLKVLLFISRTTKTEKGHFGSYGRTFMATTLESRLSSGRDLDRLAVKLSPKALWHRSLMGPRAGLTREPAFYGLSPPAPCLSTTTTPRKRNPGKCRIEEERSSATDTGPIIRITGPRITAGQERLVSSHKSPKRMLQIQGSVGCNARPFWEDEMRILD